MAEAVTMTLIGFWLDTETGDMRARPPHTAEDVGDSWKLTLYWLQSVEELRRQREDLGRRIDAARARLPGVRSF